MLRAARSVVARDPRFFDLIGVFRHLGIYIESVVFLAFFIESVVFVGVLGSVVFLCIFIESVVFSRTDFARERVDLPGGRLHRRPRSP